MRLARPQRPATRRGRLLRWLAVSLAGVLVVGAGAGFGAYHYYSGRLAHVSIRLPLVGAAADATAAPAPVSTGEQNFVLAGSDTRAAEGDQAFQAPPGSPDFVVGQRSDTAMLVHVPANETRVSVVSFPRDAYVDIPGFADAKGGWHPTHKAKLNEALEIGGPALLVRLIENLSGLHVDHYVQVDFSGFQRMVDSLGGVSLCVGTTRHEPDSGDFLTAGLHDRVDGATALSFVRDRKGLPNGDLDRIRDQQYFLAQMLKKLLSAGTLTNPLKVNAFLQAATANVTVDDGFGLDQFTTLATRLRHLDPAHVRFTTVPYGDIGATRVIEGTPQSVVLLLPRQDAAFFAALRQEGAGPAPSSAPSAAPSTGAPPGLILDPRTVRLSVRNGTATPGVATTAATQLRALGFTVSATATAPRTDVTTVHYSSDREDSARTVAAATGARMLLDPAVSGVRLVIGPDFTGVRPVTPTPAASASASASPSPSAGPDRPAGTTTAAESTCAP